MFLQVDKSWKDIMRKTYRLPNALRAATQPGLLETFQQNNSLLDQIQKCLEAYLESKCMVFPRYCLTVLFKIMVLLWYSKPIRGFYPRNFDKFVVRLCTIIKRNKTKWMNSKKIVETHEFNEKLAFES